tara:strand:- start:78 stop:728 length:651 start_codon:yes stop_codon:yes gene_type:complete
MKILSLIPARSGSKSIPDKNILMIAGKPMFDYAIKSCINSDLIDDVYVSSDSEKYIKIAQSCGAKTIKRPENISKDNSTTEEAIHHFLNNVDCDILALVQATSPLIKANFLDEAIQKLINGKYDCIVSVYKDHGFWWDNNKPMYNPKQRPMRQSQKSLYKEAGMFYIFNAQKFKKENCRIFGKTGIYEVPKLNSIIEIDEKEDIILTEILMKHLNE